MPARELEESVLRGCVSSRIFVLLVLVRFACLLFFFASRPTSAGPTSISLVRLLQPHYYGKCIGDASIPITLAHLDLQSRRMVDQDDALMVLTDEVPKLPAAVRKRVAKLFEPVGDPNLIFFEHWTS